MNTETKQKIETIVNAIAMVDIKSSRTLRDLITEIYIDGEIAGLDKAREIMTPKESINVGDEDHNLEVEILDPLFSNVNQVDELPF